jgi:hypothetical protein
VATPAIGAAAPVLAPMAVARSASACSQPLGAMLVSEAIAISQSSCAALMLCTFAPLRVAWRMRCANSGWSLRRNEPTTNTRCSFDRDAIEVPSHRTEAEPPAIELAPEPNSAWRVRWSMFSLPRQRTSLASRCNSSTVLCAEPSAPMLAGPWSTETCVRPRLT